MFSNNYFIFLFFLFSCTFKSYCSFFINIQFGNPFKISKKEINKKIEYKLSKENVEIVRKINGFYGMIGPDINISTVNTLYDLFTGDGNIQGIFFDNGELTYIKKFIRTEKLLYEEMNGRIPNHWIVTFLFMVLEKIGILPNMMGMANTALLNIENNTYALFERDLPYLLDIDYNKKNIKDKFEEIGFNVPLTYHYLTQSSDLESLTKNLSTFVAKPAHMSFCDNVFIKYKKDFEIENLNSLNDCLNMSTQREEESDMLKNCDRGIIIEEYVNVVYELKVFVVFGEPVVGDLRIGPYENHTIDFIGENNQYLNWSKEYHLISELAKSLKVDYFRVDFLYDGNKLYACECAFMPSTVLPPDIEYHISNKLRMPYLKYYYPNLC